jgi:hypothetical protein
VAVQHQSDHRYACISLAALKCGVSDAWLVTGNQSRSRQPIKILGHVMPRFHPWQMACSPMVVLTVELFRVSYRQCGHPGSELVSFHYDTDTENLARVIRKLKGYERLAQFGPRYPVLLWVPHTRRENSLLQAPSGVPTVMPVATAVHATNPAGPIWALTSDPYQRRALHHLPSDPSPDEATNPNVFSDQPEDDSDL